MLGRAERKENIQGIFLVKSQLAGQMDGRLGSSPKSNFANYNNFIKTKTERV